MTVRDSDLTIAGVLRLLGAGASGSIMMALRQGPLRTKELTERVPGYAPRTIYRYSAKLTELSMVEREEEPGVPSKVVHRLTEPSGLELADLIDAYADASLGRLPSGEIGAHEWGSFALVADLWESGMMRALEQGPRSLTELSQGDHGLSFHQVSRRATLFAIGGFIEETTAGTRYRQFALTEKARRAMALVAGIGRWRRRHVVPKGTPGLTSGEAAGLIRTVMPLVSLPDRRGQSLELKISPLGGSGAGEETVWAEVGPDGILFSRPCAPANADSVACGHVIAWVDAILDGPGKELTARGDARLLDECLRRLHEVLWGLAPAPPPAVVAAAAAPAR
jgi:DNA-binding HxlR family transcriptional regulator